MSERNINVTTAKALFENKRIIIVGNSVELMNHEYGEYIDSFDVVVRLGRAAEFRNPKNYKKYQVCLGKKFDVWSTGWMRSGLLTDRPEYFKDVKFFLMNRNSLNFELIANGRIATEKFKVSFPAGKALNMFSYDEIRKFNKEFGIVSGDKSKPRLSNGIITIKFFCEKMYKYKSLNIIGFDFFKKSTDKLRGGIWPHHSWHRPIQNVEAEVHHHDNEVKIVNRFIERGLLTWDVISDLKKENIVDSKYGDF